MEVGEVFGIVASSHGDALAYTEMNAFLREQGAVSIFHAGDITGEASDPIGCVRLAFDKGSYAVSGNHDVLAVGTERVHEYAEEVERFAFLTEQALDAEARQLLIDAPAKVETPWFAIVHESVMPPYYAKRSKRRRKSHGWDVGSSADENTTAVCYSRIDRPHFIGSDHAAYVIVGKPSLKILRPRPGEEIVIPRRSIVSVPSIAFSRDKDYDCGAILGEAQSDGALKLNFVSIHPRARSPIFPL